MALSDTGRLLRTGNPLFLFLIVSYPATDVFMPRQGKIYILPFLQLALVSFIFKTLERRTHAGRMAGEPTFPILYQVQAALGKSNLFLPPRMLTKNAFFTPLQVSCPADMYFQMWPLFFFLILWTHSQKVNFFHGSVLKKIHFNHSMSAGLLAVNELA